MGTFKPAEFWLDSRQRDAVQVWRLIDGRETLLATFTTKREAMAYMRSLPGYVQAYI